jgi:predicted dienelactone hydrolase
MFTKRLFGVLVIAALMASGLASLSLVGAQDETSAFTYAEFGSYWVGKQDMVLDEGTETALHLIIWYPALNPNAAGEEPNAEALSLKNAEVDRRQAPYPLVIFSHGRTIHPNRYTSLIKHLVSYGFVVISPNHADNPGAWTSVYGIIVQRLGEVKQAIVYADRLNDEDGAFAGAIDTETIAVMGHSRGGQTAFGAGGALIDLTSPETYCAQVADADLCLHWTDDVATIPEAVGLESTSEGLWEPIWDARVDAIIDVAGTYRIYSREGVAAITIPTMIIYGSLDSASLTEWLPSAYDYIGSSQKARVILEGASHWITVDASVGPHYKAMHFSTAFLLAILKGDADATAALSPDAVQFPDVTYKAEGF